MGNNVLPYLFCKYFEIKKFLPKIQFYTLQCSVWKWKISKKCPYFPIHDFEQTNIDSQKTKIKLFFKIFYKQVEKKY